MLTLTITDQTLENAFNKSLDALLAPGNYDNPVKRTLDGLLGYSGDKELKAQLEAQVKEMVIKAMATPEFATSLGTAMAAEIARREVDKLKR